MKNILRKTVHLVSRLKPQQKIYAIFQTLKTYTSKLRISSFVGGQLKKRQKPELIFNTNEDFYKYVNEIFFEKESRNNMLNSTRSGDSNENFVEGILKRLGYVTTIERQDDYGIDYILTVGKLFGELIYPTNTCAIQLKSNFDTIKYEIFNKNKYNWLLNHKLPFFFGIYDETKCLVHFYSTSMINDFLIRNYQNINEIHFSFRTPETNSRVDVNSKYNDNETIYKIDCGHPFLTISITDTLKQKKKIENYRNIFDKVILKENENIVYRNLGLPFFSWLHQYKTNELDIFFGWAEYSDDFIFKGDDLLNKLYQPILTLCNTYFYEKNKDKFEKLKTFVELIEYNDKTKSVLVALGYRDKQGKFIDKQIEE